nr:MAG TPA: hypothetical protein [Caudoviricetes sp.]
MKRRYDYLGMKYTPNRQHLKASGQRSKHAFIHRIAYTETMRGIRDDIPTLLFYAPLALCNDAAQYIYDILKNHVEDIRVVPSHSCRVKNGTCYWRTEVQVIGLNTELLNFESFTRMLIHRMQVICNCKIRHLKLETFLNT